jgi:ParB family chromosome partitioning protein
MSTRTKSPKSQIPKIALSASRDIPFDRLVLSQSNVRRIKAGVAIEELAEDIARRTLLQSLTVRPVLDEHCAETGMFEVPSGGRRYRALELLVKQKRLARSAPIPCVIRTEGIAEEDSLAENVQRAPLHPLDQFRAFQTLREKGQSEEEIAAAFFISVAVVKQRLRLAAVSPRLLDVYAADGMTLEQLMAFTVSPDHQRQEQVWEALQRSYAKEPYAIRRMLTEGAVRASDKRAQFVGAEAYEDAGGLILRDLFQSDEGGWWQDAGLLERLVAEKLAREAEAIRTEGWRWVEALPDFPYGHSYGLRRLNGEAEPLSEEESAAREALKAEYDDLEASCEGLDEIPEETDQRLAEIETALAAIEHRPLVYDPDEVARAGTFVSIDGSGSLRVERGFVRPEDEPPAEVEEANTSDAAAEADAGGAIAASARMDANNVSAELEEEDGLTPLSDRLVAELTAVRTLTLRHALSARPDMAFLAVLHALALRVFHHYAQDSCLEIEMKAVSFPAQVPQLLDGMPARTLRAEHERWMAQLPKDPRALWETLVEWDEDSRQALFAFVAAYGVNAAVEPYNRRPRAIRHADQLAGALDLDVAASGWRPTVEGYLGRVTKARILEAVREAKGAHAADRLAHLKKGEMAEAAETMLAGTGWLPQPLRTPGQAIAGVVDEAEASGDASASEQDDDAYAGDVTAADDPADEPMVAVEIVDPDGAPLPASVAAE